MLRLTLAAALALVAVASVLFAAVLASSATMATPSSPAVAEIPAFYLRLYQDAAARRCPTLPWPVLAAIGKVESDHGRIGGASFGPDGRVQPSIIGIALDGSNGTARILDTDRGRLDADTVFDRAVGPMQFIPSTWALHGVDASGDGLGDPHNAIDAVQAAAAYLCAVGANDPERIADALWSYNHSWEYVDRVLSIASTYVLGGLTNAPPNPTLIGLVLNNPRLDIYEAGRGDIAAGRIDARVLTLLQLASERHTLRISSLKSGHSRCVGGRDYDGCRVSYHWHGRAVDISAVDVLPVSRDNTAARALALWLGALPDQLGPTEVGTPWPELAGGPFFADGQHDRHIHVGFAPNTR